MSASVVGGPFTCRACRTVGSDEDVVLDLGSVPAADYFPSALDPYPDPVYPLSMWSCPSCGLAQLLEDPTTTSEPRGVEPLAIRQQAAAAVTSVQESHLMEGLTTVCEHGSPHGGSWLGLFASSGLQAVDPGRGATADVVADSFGLMHEPDQLAAIRRRRDELAPEGLMLLQFHSLEAIVAGQQWNALRHGHFAYFSLTSLLAILARTGLVPLRVWEFPLYDKTLLLAVAHASSRLTARELETGAHPSLERVLASEARMGLLRSETLRTLQRSADDETVRLGARVRAEASGGKRIYAYGAASRAVSLLIRAGLGRDDIPGVADASPAKQGRLMPGSRIPIISTADLLDSDPDEVLLLLPDLQSELDAALPALAGRWSLP